MAEEGVPTAARDRIAACLSIPAIVQCDQHLAPKTLDETNRDLDAPDVPSTPSFESSGGGAKGA